MSAARFSISGLIAARRGAGSHHVLREQFCQSAKILMAPVDLCFSSALRQRANLLPLRGARGKEHQPSHCHPALGRAA